MGDFRDRLMNQPSSQTALVLSGGGAYGAFAIGVMNVLFAGRSPATHYQPLETDLFVGTSVGAFNAAVMAAYGKESSLRAVQRLQEIWMSRIAETPGKCGNGVFRLRGDPTEYLNYNCLQDPARLASNLGSDTLSFGSYLFSRTANFLASSEPLRDRILSLVNFGSFVDVSPYQQLLHEVIKEEDVLRSPKRLAVVATNWITGQAIRFLNSDFHDNLGTQAVAASGAVPGVFPPVAIGNDLFVDGGVVENTPLSPALDLGATELHVIYLDPKPEYIRLPAEANTLDSLLRVYYLMLATKLEEDIETVRWINAGIRAIQGLDLPDMNRHKDLRDLVRTAGKILKAETPYKIVRVHRYFPRAALGGNLGMFNFDPSAVAQMIGEGERVALLHNCAESKCVVENLKDGGDPYA